MGVVTLKRFDLVACDMSATGLCAICQSAEAVDRCERCGTLVCRDHLEAEVGFCVDCARSLRRGKGGDTYQF